MFHRIVEPTMLLQRLLDVRTPLAAAVRCTGTSSSGSSGFGPYRLWRQHRHTTGVEEDLLKYHKVREKTILSPFDNFFIIADSAQASMGAVRSAR